MAADIPLAIDSVYFAGVIRAEESSIAELDSQTVIYSFEPLGVIAQIIPGISQY
jgi:aldehyde dehydrogenase